MNYHGPERRRGESTAVAVIETEIKYIKESVDEIKQHIQNSVNGKSAWWKTLIGIVVAMLIQTACFVFYLGGALKQLEIDTKRIDKVEAVIEENFPYRTTTTVEY